MTIGSFSATSAVVARARPEDVHAAFGHAALDRWYADSVEVRGGEVRLSFDEEFGYRVLQRCALVTSASGARLEVRHCERTFEGTAVPGVDAAAVALHWGGTPSAAGDSIDVSWASAGDESCSITAVASGTCDDAVVADRFERARSWWDHYLERLAETIVSDSGGTR